MTELLHGGLSGPASGAERLSRETATPDIGSARDIYDGSLFPDAFMIFYQEGKT